MPEDPRPKIRPTYTLNGETREWDGAHWVPLGTGAAEIGAPKAPMINLPNAPYTPEQQAATQATGMSLLKNLLMTGGMLAGGATGVPAALIGGAALGRMAGHVPEALTEAATGRPSGDTFLDAGLTGAMQGAEAEMVPRVAAPIARVAGKGAVGLGRIFLDTPYPSIRQRAYAALLRGTGARLLGAPEAVQGAAAVGPIIATEAGRRLEGAGARWGEEGLAERLGGAWDALKARLMPATHAEELAAGAESYAARKAAPWRVPEPYPKPGPTGGDPHVNPFAYTAEGPAVPWESPIPEPTVPPEQGTWAQWRRGGPVTGPEAAGPRVGTKPSTGSPPEWGPTGRPPDPDVTTPGVRSEGFAGTKPSTGDVTINPEGAVMSTTEQPPWLDQYAIPESEYAPAVETLRSRSLPANKVSDARYQELLNQFGGRGAEESAVAAAPKPPTNLTPDDLVNEYVRQYPPKGSPAPATTPATTPPSEIDALREKLSGSFAKQYNMRSPEEFATDVSADVARRTAAREARTAALRERDAVQQDFDNFTESGDPDADAASIQGLIDRVKNTIRKP
jgi:hypothetical protein